MPDGTLEDMEQLNKIREAVYEEFKAAVEASVRGKDNTVQHRPGLYSLIQTA